MQVALRLRKCWLCFIKQKGHTLLPSVGREVLSLMWGSRLFLGQWDVGYVVSSERQWCDTSWPLSGGAKWRQAPLLRGQRVSSQALVAGRCAKGTRPWLSWLSLTLPEPLFIATTGCPILSHTCPCFPSGCKHPSCFPTLLTPSHFYDFIDVCIFSSCALKHKPMD